MVRRSGRGVRVAVLVEDGQHGRFARRVLRQLGFHPREFRIVPYPEGRGSGEQWVRENYAGHVKAHRRKANSQQVGLMVLIDADTRTVAHRHNQLAQKLQKAGLKARSGEEAIIIWVPKRNIHTWVAYLLDRDVDVNEQDDYERLVRDEDYRTPAERFVELYREASARPDDLLPAMSKAFTELQRLPD